LLLVFARLDHHTSWWREHRKGARWSVKKAARAAYAEIKRNPEIGTPYDAEGATGIRFLKTATEHALYYLIVEKDPERPYVLVVGVKGPWEDEPYFGGPS
jgi:plasmid stabilization system protein ParE